MHLTRWLEQARQGDRDAFCELCGDEMVHRWLLAIASWLPRRLRAKTDPADILQDVLDRAWRDIGSLESTDTQGFNRWILAIARHRVRDVRRHYESRKRNAQVEQDFHTSAASGAQR